MQHVTRLGGERPRDAEPALVAVRERRRPARPRAAESPSSSSSSVARRRASRGPRADAERGDLDVLAHRERAGTSGCAGTSARARRARAGAALQRVTSLPLELDRPRGREVEAGEHVDERRLAGAVRADQPDDLVPVQLERHAVERLHARRTTRETAAARRDPPGRRVSVGTSSSRSSLRAQPIFADDLTP